MKFPSAHPFSLLSLLFLVVARVSLALSLTAGPDCKPTDTGAVVTWRTDVVCGTRLSYGTDPKMLTQRVEGETSQEHSVTLNGLAPGTTYHFSVGSARQQLGTGSFTTTGKAPAGAAVAKSTTKPTPAPQAKPAETALPAPPPTRVSWGNLESLQDHFNRHGQDFKATSPDDYAAKAWTFLQRARRDALPMKWDDADGTLRVWEPSTRSFAAYDRRGKARTFFKPSNPDYWVRQPGRPIKPAELPFH